MIRYLAILGFLLAASPASAQQEMTWEQYFDKWSAKLEVETMKKLVPRLRVHGIMKKDHDRPTAGLQCWFRNEKQFAEYYVPKMVQTRDGGPFSQQGQVAVRHGFPEFYFLIRVNSNPKTALWSREFDQVPYILGKNAKLRKEYKRTCYAATMQTKIYGGKPQATKTSLQRKIENRPLFTHKGMGTLLFWRMAGTMCGPKEAQYHTANGGKYDIRQPLRVDHPYQMEARFTYPGLPHPVQFHIKFTTSYVDEWLRDLFFSEQQMVNAMNEFLYSFEETLFAMEEDWRRQNQPAIQPPPRRVDPTPRRTPPKVDRRPPPKDEPPKRPPPKKKEPEVTEPIKRPDQPSRPADTRLDEMIAILEPLETDLQAGLLQIKTLSEAVKKMREEVKSLRHIVKTSEEVNKETFRDELKKQVKRLKAMEKFLNRQVEITLGLMETSMARVEEIFNEGGFGELYPHAERVVRTGRTRHEFLKGQVLLVSGKTEELFRFTGTLKSKIGGSAKAYFMEGFAHLQEGNTLAALQAFRDARGWGMISKDEARRRGKGESGFTPVGSKIFNSVMSGEMAEAMQRELEIHFLHQLQQKATGASEKYKRLFAREFDKASEMDKQRGFLRTWLKRLFRTGIADAFEGGMGAVQKKITGDSLADARADELGTIVDDMANTHIGIGVVIGLRKGGFTLDEIRQMDAEAFHAAVEKTWAAKLDPQRVEKLRRVMTSHALSLEDMQDFMGGKDLTEPGVLSGEMVQEMKDESGWAKARDWGKFAANFVDGWTLLTTFAPSAQVGTLGDKLGVKATTTVGEYFSSTGAVQKAVEKLQASGLGRQALEKAQQVQAWAGDSKLRRARLFVYEQAANIGASYAIGKTLGEEAQMAFDVVQMTGATSTQFWADGLERAGMTASKLAAAADQIEQKALVADNILQELGDLQRQVMQAVEEAGERGLSGRQVEAFRKRARAIQAKYPNHTIRLTDALEEAAKGRAASAKAGLKGLGRMVKQDRRRVEAAKKTALAYRKAAAQLPDAPATPTNKMKGTGADVEPKGTLTDITKRSTEGTLKDLKRKKAPPPPPKKKPHLPEHESPRLHLEDPSFPTHEADKLMAQKKFAEAKAAYLALEKQVHNGELDRKLLDILNKKHDLAELAEQSAKSHSSLSGSAGEGLAAGTLQTVDGALTNSKSLTTLDDLVRGGQMAHLENVPSLKGIGKGTAGKQWVLDAEGKKVAVLMEITDTNAGEGMAEEIASRILGTAGKRGPQSRIISQTVNGKTKHYLVTEFFEGHDWEDLAPHLGDMLARKEDLADDLAWRLLFGDGDSHLGNFKITPDGATMGFDFGGADMFSSHDRWRNVEEIAAGRKRFGEYLETLRQAAANPDLDDEARRVLEETLAKFEEAGKAYNVHAVDDLKIPYVSRDDAMSLVGELSDALKAAGPHGVEIDDLFETVNQVYTRAVYNHPKFGNPMELTDELFEEFVEANMNRVFDHATHQWGDRHGLLQSSMHMDDFKGSLDAMKNKVRSRLEDIVEQSMKGMDPAEKAFTRKLLEKRIDIMERFLEKKFRTLPKTSLLFPRPQRRAA